MAGCRPVTASSRRPRRRATSPGRRPACAGSPRRRRRWRRHRGGRARRGPTTSTSRCSPRAGDPAGGRAAGAAGWRRPTRPVRRPSAAGHRAGRHGWLGPLSEPLPLALGAWSTWGTFYAQARILPLLGEAVARGALDPSGAAVLERLAARVDGGAFDTGEPPARLHGDLWSGNVLWTADEAVLIDPAAHGGHREADLAMLRRPGHRSWSGCRRRTARRHRSPTAGATACCCTRCTRCSCTPCSSAVATGRRRCGRPPATSERAVRGRRHAAPEPGVPRPLRHSPGGGAR